MTYIDYCPSCGGWDKSIVETTGWCVACSLAHHPDLLYCRRCGDPYPRNKNGLYCSPCKDRNWLEQHIDEVEIYMVQGYKFSVAKRLVAQNIRPTCVVCKQQIRGGPRTALFCSRTINCIDGRKKYHILIRKGVPSDIALSLLGYTDQQIIEAA